MPPTPSTFALLATLSFVLLSACSALPHRTASVRAASEAPTPSTSRSPQSPLRPVSTYSIVARDAATGDLGVAVQSHWFSVGSVVPWAEAGVGAVATQSFVEPSYGPLGLDLMRTGRTAQQALTALTSSDPGASVRQVAFVDASGNIAAHTGADCIAHASHITGKSADGSAYSVQANLMGPDTVPKSMSAAFESAKGDLADRLLAALNAAQAAGGDIRGRQSAAMLIVKAHSSGKPWQDRVVDLRIEDNPDPLAELARLLNLSRAYAHMNAGDLAVEHHDIDGAMKEYNAAHDLAPKSAEMSFWTGVTLANAGRVDDSLAFFKLAFDDKEAGAGWLELVGRLPAAKLLPDDKAMLAKIRAQAKN